MPNPPSRKHLQSPDPPPVHAVEAEINNGMEGPPESKRQRYGPTKAATTLINQQELATQRVITPDTCTTPGNSSVVGDRNATRGVYHQHPIGEEMPINCASPDSMASPAWQHTIEKTILAIVAVHFSQVRAFDTEPPYTSQASGFVVDAER
ncbi:hypothetical protein IWQ61_009579, partial [Dispira simplex]